MGTLEGAVAWKLQLIKELRRQIADKISEEVRKERIDVDEIIRLVNRFNELREEEKDVTGKDKHKKWQVCKNNLERQIATEERLLHGLIDPETRVEYEREIEALKALLAVLQAEPQ